MKNLIIIVLLFTIIYQRDSLNRYRRYDQGRVTATFEWAVLGTLFVTYKDPSLLKAPSAEVEKAVRAWRDSIRTTPYPENP